MVVDVGDALLDVEEPDLTVGHSGIVVESHVELVPRETHSGPRRNFGAFRSLTTQVFSRTPDFGPGTSAPHLLERGLGYIALLCAALEQVLRMVRADSTGAGHPSQADLRRTAQPE